jgi:hypothetical protein
MRWILAVVASAVLLSGCYAGTQGTVQVTLTSSTSTPIVNAVAIVRDSSGRAYTVTTNSAGSAAVGVPSGSFQVSSSGCETETVTVEPSKTTDVTLSCGSS